MVLNLLLLDSKQSYFQFQLGYTFLRTKLKRIQITSRISKFIQKKKKKINPKPHLRALELVGIYKAHGSEQSAHRVEINGPARHELVQEIHAHDLPAPVVLVLHHLERARFERRKLLLLRPADHRLELLASGRHADPIRIHPNRAALAHRAL